MGGIGGSIVGPFGIPAPEPLEDDEGAASTEGEAQ